MWTRRANKAICFSLAFLPLALLTPSWIRGQQSISKASQATGTFEELSTQANSSREAGKTEEALRSYRSALKLRPTWIEGWWYVGTMLYDADQYSDAVPALQKVVALNSKFGPALAFLGLSEFETKDYKKSLEHLREADQHGYGDDAELAKVAKYHLALLFNWNGEFDKSIQIVREGFAGSRIPEQAKNVLGIALLRIPLLPGEIDSSRDALIHAAGEAGDALIGGDPEKIRVAFQHLIMDYPQTPYLHYAYANALASEDKYDEAIEQLKQESRITPASDLPLTLAASIQLRAHRPKEALASAQQAVHVAPRSAAAHEVLARSLEAAGRTQEAAIESALSRQLKSHKTEIEISQRRLYAASTSGEKRPGTLSGAARPPASAGGGANYQFLVQKAAAAKANGQVDDAISYYKQALAGRADWAEGWQELGTLCYGQGRYPEAIEALKKSTAAGPGNGTSWALLGLAEFETGDYKNSRIHLERGRDLGLAGNAAALQIAKYHLALLLNQAGEFDRAMEVLTPESGSGPAKDQVKFALGIALLRMPVLPAEIDPSKEPLVRSAGETAAMLVESQYDQAFALFKQMLRDYPGTLYLHYAYGSALMSTSEYDQAEKEFEAETAINPSSALPYRRRAAIALQLRRVEDALQLAQQAVQLDARSGEGHYLLGRAWLENGKTENSIQELETARTLAPNSPEVHFALARAYAKAGRSESAEQERNIFQNLNAAVQKQRSTLGSQAYGAKQNQNGIQAAEGTNQPQSPANPR